MKAYNRAKFAFIKWTAIIFVPVILLLMIMVVTRNFKKTYHIAEDCCNCIKEMIEHRSYKTRVAYRGYELIIK